MKKLVDIYYFKDLYLDTEEKIRERTSGIDQPINILQVAFPTCIIDSNEYFVNICRICLTAIDTDLFLTLSTEIENVQLGHMIKAAMPELVNISIYSVQLNLIINLIY